MQTPKPRSVDQIIESPEAGRLLVALAQTSALSQDQILRYLWRDVYSDLPARRQRDFVRSDLNRMVESYILAVYTIPVVWPPLVKDTPAFEIAVSDRTVDFAAIAAEFVRRVPANAEPRLARIYTLGDCFKRAVPQEYAMWPYLSNHRGYLPSILNRESLGSSSLHPQVPSAFVVSQLLANTYATSLLNLAEVYLQLRERSDPAIPEWSTWNHLLYDASFLASSRPFARPQENGKAIGPSNGLRHRYEFFATGLDANLIEGFRDKFKLDPESTFRLW